jgi:hypothetical protein
MISPSKRTDASKPTIEDLFQIKRAERPSPEFWTRFEQDLRTKQLAAIIEKRPWWISLRLPQLARQMARFQVPVGAAAMLALSFVVVREYRTSDVREFGQVASQHLHEGREIPAGRKASTPYRPGLTNADVAGDSAVLADAGEKNDSRSYNSKQPVRVTSADEVSSSESLMSMIPWAAPRVEGVTATTAKESPVGELSQVHFASAVVPGLDHDFGGTVELDPLVVSQPPSAAGEWLRDSDAVASITPREVRRSRILTNLATADVASTDTEPSRLGRIREILVSSLDDDHLYDSVRRVGMGGDRFTVKF